MAENTVLWRCRGNEIALSKRTLVMGILNVTPDSFSDGGRYFDVDRAIAHGLSMIKDGADIIDIGGESTRPGAEPVALDEELRRIIPVVKALGAQKGCLLSVDTMKAEVARQALEEGVSIINDVSALTVDPDMVTVAKRYQAGVVLMHMRGSPRTMQTDTRYADVVGEVNEYLLRRTAEAVSQGLPRECIALDPGIGFGKTSEQNLQLLGNMGVFVGSGRPVLVGLSRKSFLSKVTGCSVEDRLAASLGAMVCAIERGARIVRVHDVRESCQAARIAEAIIAGEKA